jgi:dephospho-CoA kinase
VLKVGLTGGIGCGKSTAIDAFRLLGVPIIDADQIAKDIVKPGEQALLKISEKFGKKILLKNGELDRKQLKKLVFNDPDALATLENILHPVIKNRIKAQMRNFKDKAYVVVDIPLLVEKNYQQMFDRIIVVDCLPKQQLDRVNKRDGLSAKEIQNIIKTQATRELRKKEATDILDNSLDKNSLLQQINFLHDKFERLSKNQL